MLFIRRLLLLLELHIFLSFITAENFLEDLPTCICVPPNMCADDNAGINGDGNLDVRLDDGVCPNYFDVCCDNPIENSSTPTSEYVFKGCGIKNPIGIAPRITDNSQLSQFGELPWTVIIMVRDITKTERNVYRCGGSIIHLQVILTAGHCVLGLDHNLLTIRVGEWDTKSLDESIPFQDLLVKEIVVHPNFNSGSLKNDIALLFLSEPIVIKDNIGVICLPPHNFKMDTTICTASGWGKDSFTKGKHSSTLKKVDLPLVGRINCENALKKTRLGAFFKLHRSFICAGGEENKDTCKGDGGSPLVCPIPGDVNRFFQIGIVSWGIGCGENGTPGVYVNVPLFSNWIDKQLTDKGLDISMYKYGTVLE